MFIDLKTTILQGAFPFEVYQFVVRPDWDEALQQLLADEDETSLVSLRAKLVDDISRLQGAVDTHMAMMIREVESQLMQPLDRFLHNLYGFVTLDELMELNEPEALDAIRGMSKIGKRRIEDELHARDWENEERREEMQREFDKVIVLSQALAKVLSLIRRVSIGG